MKINELFICLYSIYIFITNNVIYTTYRHTLLMILHFSQRDISKNTITNNFAEKTQLKIGLVSNL